MPESHGNSHTTVNNTQDIPNDSKGTRNNSQTTESHENSHTFIDIIQDTPDDSKRTSKPASVSLPSAKDQGYGWVVMMASFLINILALGWLRTFSLVILAVQEHFNDYSSGSVGVVLGLNYGFSSVLIPVWGWFIGRFGHRACGIAGALTMSSGLLLATQASTMLEMAIPLGAMGGIGLSMVNLPGIFLVTQYFEKRRATANGIRLAGMPLGGMIMPFVFLACRNALGLKGTFIIFAGILLHIAALATLYRPFEVQRNLVQRQYLRAHIKDMEIRNTLLGGELSQTSKTKDKKKSLQWSYLCNPVFAVQLMSGIFFTGAFPVGVSFRQIYAKSIGISSLDITTVTSIGAVFEFFVRPAIGAMADKKIFTKWKGLIVGMCFYGFITGMMTLVLSNFWSFLAVSILQTIGTSLYVTLFNVVIADLYGEDLFPTTFGYIRSSQGICNFITPVLIGFVSDATGSLDVAFYLMGTMGILAGLTMLLQPIINRRTGLKIKFT